MNSLYQYWRTFSARIRLSKLTTMALCNSVLLLLMTLWFIEIYQWYAAKVQRLSFSDGLTEQIERQTKREADSNMVLKLTQELSRYHFNNDVEFKLTLMSLVEATMNQHQLAATTLSWQPVKLTSSDLSQELNIRISGAQFKTTMSWLRELLNQYECMTIEKIRISRSASLLTHFEFDLKLNFMGWIDEQNNMDFVAVNRLK